MSAPRVLVIDDEADFAAFVGEASRRLGHEVRICLGSVEAKRDVVAFRPDLIVLDIVMPGEDGVEFLQWFSQQGIRARLILITGFSAKYAELATELSVAAGLDVAATLTKPVRAQALQETLALHARSVVGINSNSASDE